MLFVARVRKESPKTESVVLESKVKGSLIIVFAVSNPNMCVCVSQGFPCLISKMFVLFIFVFSNFLFFNIEKGHKHTRLLHMLFSCGFRVSYTTAGIHLQYFNFQRVLRSKIRLWENNQETTRCLLQPSSPLFCPFESCLSVSFLAGGFKCGKESVSQAA